MNFAIGAQVGLVGNCCDRVEMNVEGVREVDNGPFRRK